MNCHTPLHEYEECPQHYGRKGGVVVLGCGHGKRVHDGVGAMLDWDQKYLKF